MSAVQVDTVGFDVAATVTLPTNMGFPAVNAVNLIYTGSCVSTDIYPVAYTSASTDIIVARSTGSLVAGNVLNLAGSISLPIPANSTAPTAFSFAVIAQQPNPAIAGAYLFWKWSCSTATTSISAGVVSISLIKVGSSGATSIVLTSDLDNYRKLVSFNPASGTGWVQGCEASSLEVPGSQTVTVTAPSLSECAAQCTSASNPSCTFFSYNSTNSSCQLHKGQGIDKIELYNTPNGTGVKSCWVNTDVLAALNDSTKCTSTTTNPKILFEGRACIPSTVPVPSGLTSFTPTVQPVSTGSSCSALCAGAATASFETNSWASTVCQTVPACATLPTGLYEFTFTHSVATTETPAPSRLIFTFPNIIRYLKVVSISTLTATKPVQIIASNNTISVAFDSTVPTVGTITCTLQVGIEYGPFALLGYGRSILAFKKTSGGVATALSPLALGTTVSATTFVIRTQDVASLLARFVAYRTTSCTNGAPNKVLQVGTVFNREIYCLENEPCGFIIPPSSTAAIAYNTMSIMSSRSNIILGLSFAGANADTPEKRLALMATPASTPTVTLNHTNPFAALHMYSTDNNTFGVGTNKNSGIWVGATNANGGWPMKTFGQTAENALKSSDLRAMGISLTTSTNTNVVPISIVLRDLLMDGTTAAVYILPEEIGTTGSKRLSAAV